MTDISQSGEATFEIKVQEVNYKVTFTARTGIFSVTVGEDGQELSSSKLNDLEESIKTWRSRNRVKASIPAVYIQSGQGRGWTLQNVTLTGVHASNGDLLARDGSDKSLRLSTWRGSSSLFKPVTALQEAEFEELVGKFYDARKAVETFIDGLDKFDDAREMVERAVRGES